jgi:hypothetical protein
MSAIAQSILGTLYFFDRIKYNYDWLIGSKKSCMVQCIDDNNDIEYKKITFFGNSLVLYHAMNNETDYSWENIVYKFRKLGHTLKNRETFETLYGEIEVIQYECPIFGPKLVFKDTSIFVE